jgi:hypothetical protein
VIVMNVSSTWSRASSRLGADAQARIVLDQIQLDLQGALYRDDGNVWMAAEVLNNSNGVSTLWQIAQRNPKPVGGLSLDIPATRTDLRTDERGRLDRSRFGAAGVWLRFFTSNRGSNASTATMSAPVAVGYQIVRRFTATNPANLNTAYLLHRSEARPATTSGRIGVLEAGYNITSSNYTSSTSSTNSGGITGDPRSIMVPGAVRNLDSIFAAYNTAVAETVTTLIMIKLGFDRLPTWIPDCVSIFDIEIATTQIHGHVIIPITG